MELEDNTINFRDDGGVIADVVTNGVIFQIRTYKKVDDDRKEGSKQNIQLNKENAEKLMKLLDSFIKHQYV